MIFIYFVFEWKMSHCMAVDLQQDYALTQGVWATDTLVYTIRKYIWAYNLVNSTLVDHSLVYFHSSVAWAGKEDLLLPCFVFFFY